MCVLVQNTIASTFAVVQSSYLYVLKQNSIVSTCRFCIRVACVLVYMGACLQSIINNRELSYSLAVREFLAYDSDPGIAFVRKPSDVQRFDHVSSTFDHVRTA